ncbi:MAG: gamma carbonic anhydrase family protein [Acidimicrobiales bacterium]|nr:gamma carbonic anhydrase family protein [Acidimicrobiales bacterium]
MPIYALGQQVPVIHPSAYVSPDAVLIGSVTIGAESSVWPGAVLRGDDGSIEVGDRTSIQDGAVLHTTPFWPTVVGNEVTVGHIAHLEACTVEDGALIGSGAVVLHRAVIGRQALVGAGAVVSGDTVVPPRAMALGVPARIREDAVDTEYVRHGMESYVKRAVRYREELRRID